jgi:hypothetical protein
MHCSFENLIVTNTPSLHASFVDIHHNTSLRFILENDSISSTSKGHIHFFFSKGIGLWLVAKPFIYWFCITHSTFILALHFYLNLILSSTFNSFHMWMCTQVGRIWHSLNSLHVWKLTDSHTWCHLKCHVCPCSREWTCCMERVVVCPYVKSFITSQFLHDPRGPSFYCRCGGY